MSVIFTWTTRFNHWTKITVLQDTAHYLPTKVETWNSPPPRYTHQLRCLKRHLPPISHRNLYTRKKSNYPIPFGGHRLYIRYSSQVRYCAIVRGLLLTLLSSWGRQPLSRYYNAHFKNQSHNRIKKWQWTFKQRLWCHRWAWLKE